MDTGQAWRGRLAAACSAHAALTDCRSVSLSLMTPVFPDIDYQPLDLLLAAHRRAHGDKPALVDVDNGMRYSFAELADTVDAAAEQLVAQGVRPGTRVLLLADNSVEKIVLWLAVWRAAAVVCPLDVAFVGAAAAARMLAAIDPVAVLCQAGADVGYLPANLVPRVIRVCRGAIDGRHIDLTRAPTQRGDLPPGAGLADIAAMCCTSGTTGMPKVIVYDHAAYWINGLSGIEFLELVESDRMLEFRSFNWYSAQILSLMPFLQTGLTLHVARRFSRSRFASWITQHAITVCAGLPAVVNLLLIDPPETTAPAFASLTRMTSSTGPLSGTQWQRFEDTYRVPLLNLYGSSETGWLAGNRLQERVLGTVGRRASYIDLRIVDADGQVCPPGLQGHVVAEGAKLALGRLQPDGTLDPIRGRPFFTRDMAVEDEQGYIRIGGRSDDLIMRGGIKMMPQEIEDVLLGHPGVLDAAVMGIPDAIYGQEVVCVIVPRANRPFDIAALLVYGAARLPHEKTPKQVFVVDAIPRSERGKILRDRLKPLWWSATQRTGMDDSEA